MTRNSLNIGQCDGIIATGLRKNDFEGVIKAFEKPLVVFGQNEMGYDFIDVNNEKGTFMATRHVMGLGSGKLSFGIDLDEPFERAREQGYIRAMNKSFKNRICFGSTTVLRKVRALQENC